MTVIMAPESEAPSEFMFYIPKYKAFCAAEDATHTLHNLYTLRGAKVRDALLWSKYLQAAIDMFGGEMEVLFASHYWPTWGNDRIVAFLKAQRDMYRIFSAGQGVSTYASDGPCTTCRDACSSQP
jgi:alkyl sulfatase BDS1-like metallo-beta-lactamase superfamily hydrolase